MIKRTSLYDEHKKLGGRLIDFGGWELPIQYTSIMDEHQKCRSSAGLFDVSHMGEVSVRGRAAEAYLNELVTNDVVQLSVGQALYTVMCNPLGGIVDDLVIYRRAVDQFLLVINASNTDKDFQHIKALQDKFQLPAMDLQIANVSDQYTQIAIQGRKASGILAQMTSTPLDEIKTYWFAEGEVLNRIPAIIARTGYTGEDGFELYIPWEKGPEVWRSFLEMGKEDRIVPCGLGARDTLRMEMKYPLYGNELTDETSPLEAGLQWVVKLNKESFVGRSALLELKERGIPRRLVGIKLLGPGIPRHGYKIWNAEGSRIVGELTSGTQSPSLGHPIGIGYVETDLSKLGSKITVEIRNTRIPAEVIPTPFYKKPY